MLALAAASLIWGTSDVVGKVALDDIPPVTLATLRFAVALVVLAPLARRAGGPSVPAKAAAPLGFLGVALAFFLQNLGLDRTAASNASLLQGAVPVLTLVFAAALLHERLGRRRLAAVVIAAVGVAALTLSTDAGVQAPGLGDALVLASAGCFAGFIVLGRSVFPTYGTLPVLAAMVSWGLAALIPLAGIELWFTRPTSFDASHSLMVLYLGAGCSALTFALWGYALCHLEASRAAMFDALIPVVGLVAAVVVLRDSPTVWQLLGGALVISAIWIAMREPKPAAVAIAA